MFVERGAGQPGSYELTKGSAGAPQRLRLEFRGEPC